MKSRYENNKITRIFTDENKLLLWQETELAVIQAMVNLDMIDQEICDQIETIWKTKPIDIDWWKTRDKEIHHDLNAFIDERLRHLPAELHQYVHKNITSYDTEEPAFGRMLSSAINIVTGLQYDLEATIEKLAQKYRYTIMNARTHGQEAEMQSFGARCLTWLKNINQAHYSLDLQLEGLEYSKISGAIGKYGSISPELERAALDILGFEAFHGATQIMPRILYAPIAQSLCNLVIEIDKIATDIRLGARSGRPILQEPFLKKQKGSSAMPHKKNTIRTEQSEGMARMAKGYMLMITDNIKTWEERAIEQSCVERVAWEDLFHVTARSLSVLNGVLKNLTVYPDNMLLEIYESRGVYASSEVKEFLKERLIKNDKIRNDLVHEDIYRIVQLASFNVFSPEPAKQKVRENIPTSFHDYRDSMKIIAALPLTELVSIQEFIPKANLRVSAELAVTEQQVEKYNYYLKKLFEMDDVISDWNKLFHPAFLLQNESILYKEIIDE